MNFRASREANAARLALALVIATTGLSLLLHNSELHPAEHSEDSCAVCVLAATPFVFSATAALIVVFVGEVLTRPATYAYQSATLPRRRSRAPPA